MKTYANIKGAQDTDMKSNSKSKTKNMLEENDAGRKGRKIVRTLDELDTGQKGKIIKLVPDKSLKSKMLSMGITNGREVTVTGKAPLGDPIELDVMGYKLSLRKYEAAQIFVEVL
jgi:ferrous iron transport protein A